MIDLRSDTVTHPTPAMRKAMYQAEVGDDVMGEDPSINRLEEMAAECMGKPAAIFVVSGTMGNLTALLSQCRRGDEVILGDQSHILINEAGGMAALGGIQPRSLPNQPDGTLDLEQVQRALRTDNIHFPRSRLIALENTHNLCGGVAIPPAYFAAVRELANRHGLLIHLDGARIFNAAVALGVEPQEITQYVDSVTFCLSKGLSAPVGSVLCGSVDLIYHARRVRKMVGGGMRQAGILAAAGIVALEQVVDGLAEDHVRARRLAEGMANIPGITVNLESVQTNIVYFDLTPDAKLMPGEMAAQMRQRGVFIGWNRAVTHCQVDDADIETTLAALNEVMRQ